MEVETVTLHSFDLPLPLNLEIDSTAVDAPGCPSEIEATVAGDLPEQNVLEPTAADASPCSRASRSSSELEAAGLMNCTGRNVVERTAGDAPPSLAELESAASDAPICERSECKAATKLQKVYRSYRTRRRLADSAVVAEELWWQVLDYARLNHSTVSFFNYLKPETAISRWNRISLNASKVGQGLSKDGKAVKLAFQHWIEAIDPRHRYGHNLHFYYEEWCRSEAGQPFFYWLDIGDGRDLDLKECPRSLLQKQCIKYLGPHEREHYRYVPIGGKIMHKQTGELLDTTKGPEGNKWIFVMSTSSRLYAGQKRKGMFHHSSFLAGGATLAAGRFTAENGVLKSIWAYSGHYRPTEENLNNFLTFLRDNGIDLSAVQIPASSNEDYYDDAKQSQKEKVIKFLTVPNAPQLELPSKMVVGSIMVPNSASQVDESTKTDEAKVSFKRTLSGGLQSPRADVPEKEILRRIKSKREASSYQLGHQLSLKWCTGAGPRIGCVADYPLELRVQALEFVNLSPKIPTSSGSRRFVCCASPASNFPPTCSHTSDTCHADTNADVQLQTISIGNR